jgi:hypothetical protein
MFLAKAGVARMRLVGALVCGLSVLDASTAAADWNTLSGAQSDGGGLPGAAGRGSFYGPIGTLRPAHPTLSRKASPQPNIRS